MEIDVQDESEDQRGGSNERKETSGNSSIRTFNKQQEVQSNKTKEGVRQLGKGR